MSILPRLLKPDVKHSGSCSSNGWTACPFNSLIRKNT